MNFKRFHESKNLFNYSTVTTGYRIQWTTGNDYPDDTAVRSDYIPVRSGTYSCSDSVIVLGYDASKNYMGATNGDGVFEKMAKIPITQFTILANSDCNYIKILSFYNAQTPMNIDAGTMLNTGSTPLPYEPYSSEVWHDTSHYIHNTSTDTITTLPADIYVNDTTATVGLKGNMEQSGTPSPDSPIQPGECGERTGNLFDGNAFSTDYPNSVLFINDTITLRFHASELSRLYSTGINVNIPANSYFSCTPLETQNAATSGRVRFIYTDDTVKEVYITKSDGTPSTGRGTLEKAVKSIRFNWSDFNSGFSFQFAMLNLGDTALPYEPYGYKIPISSGGKNLFDKDKVTFNCWYTANGTLTQPAIYGCITAMHPVSAAALTISWSGVQPNSYSFVYFDVNGDFIERKHKAITPDNKSYTATTPEGATQFIAQVSCPTNERLTQEKLDSFKIMLNFGSTPLPYEPYNRTKTPVYLGVAQSARRIKKLVLDGTEGWAVFSDDTKTYRLVDAVPTSATAGVGLCTHYIVGTGTSTLENEAFYMTANRRLYIRDTNYDTLTAFTTYLAQQYAAGTPVTVWYVLATEETGIVNEPLRKIDDYADEVSGITIPTIAGANTLTVDTTLQPSEVTVNYKGWHLATSVKNYIHNGIDIITTLPVTISADGNAFVGLQGNMTQSSTPTPTTPIQPQECGDRTGNLLDCNVESGMYDSTNGQKKDQSSYNRTSDYIAVSPNTNYTLGINSRSYTFYVSEYNNSKTFIQQVTVSSNTYYTSSANCAYITFYRSTSGGSDYWQVNEGTSLINYQPYGYKIPILSGGVTTPVYLGEVETTRRIKKLVLTGNETGWTKASSTRVFYILSEFGALNTANVISCMCSHYEPQDNVPNVSGVSNLKCCFRTIAQTLYIHDDTFESNSDFVAYLQAQYAAGTPVTVWYVLAEPTTGIVNEPLRKIGDYVDTVDNISIPTITGDDIINVETTLKPSKMKIKYNSWIDGNISYLLADNPLCGIDTYKDTLNLATGACTRKIKKVVFDGTEDWGMTSGNKMNLTLTDIPSVGVSPICTHYKGISATSYVSVNNNEITVSIVQSENSKLALYDDRFTSKSDFLSFLAQQYAAGTPVTVWYVLAEPTTETITVPTGLFGTEEGYLNQSGTPTPTNPIYPTANEVPMWN